MPKTQQELDFALVTAVQIRYKENPTATKREIEELLELGADPTANAEDTSGKTHQALVDAIMDDNLEVLRMMLSKLSKTGRKVDFSLHPTGSAYNHVCSQYNLFATSLLYCNLPTIDYIYTYALKHKQDMLEMVNERIYYEKAKLNIYLPHFLMEKISAFSITTPVSLSTSEGIPMSELIELKKYLTQWVNHSQRTGLSRSNTNPISINWSCKEPLLKYLLSKGLLDFDAILYNDVKLKDYITSMCDTGDIDNWTNIHGTFIAKFSRKSIGQFSISKTEPGAGPVLIEVEIKNAFDLIPLQFKIRYDASAVKKMMDAHLLKEEQAADARRLRRHSSGTARTLAEVHVLKSKVADLAEQRLKDIRAELSNDEYTHDNILPVFNVVHQIVSAQFLASKIATTKLFAVKTTNKYAKAAQVTQSLFQVSTEGIPVPFVNILPAITGGLMNMAIESQTNAQHGAAANATLGMDTERLSVDIAALVTCKFMMEFKDQRPDKNLAKKLAAHIVDRINSLKGKTFESQKDLVDYLCEPAIQHLNQQKSFSSGSTATSSGHKKKSGPSCTIS